MSENPVSRWYWNDWDNDRALALCTLAAQGLWMRMLSIAAREGGYVRVNGVPCTAEHISVLVGRSVDEVAPLIAELEKFGVFSRTRDGCCYNRRMVRDEKTRQKNIRNGKQGGNPKLRVTHSHSSEKSQSDNPPLKDLVKAPDKGGVGDPVAPLYPYTPLSKKFSYENLSGNGVCRLPDVAAEMTKIWNEECGHISRANKPNAGRVSRCAKAWRDEFDGVAENWRAYCKKIAASPHLRGENDRGWHVDMDWVLKPENMAHILEGRYDRRDNVSIVYERPDRPAPKPEELFGNDYSGAVGMAR